jgi:glycosyltransferase involved in cell wall biosynthesis
MKIFQVSTFFHPVTGGVESHVAVLSKYLKDEGHEVMVLTSDSSKIGQRIGNRTGSFEGIPIKRFITFLSLSEYHRLFPGLFFYLLKNDFDIVHVHGFRKFETYLALLAAKIKRKKVILTTHNPFPTTTRSKWSEFLIKIHDLTFGKFLLNKLDKIITILPSEQDIFINKFKVDPLKLITVFNGINPIMLEPGDANIFFKEYEINKADWDAIVIGCGRLNYAKGFQFLHKAVSALPRVLFFIAGGDDGYYEDLKRIYFANDNIIFNAKYIPQEKLRDVYAAGDIFVLPSIHEATGGVLLEALAQGCGIIASDKGGTIEYLTNKHGIFVDPKDQEAWLREITKLLSNPEKKTKLLENKGNFLKKYRWDLLAKKILKIYNEVSNGKSNPKIK